MEGIQVFSNLPGKGQADWQVGGVAYNDEARHIEGRTIRDRGIIMKIEFKEDGTLESFTTGRFSVANGGLSYSEEKGLGIRNLGMGCLNDSLVEIQQRGGPTVADLKLGIEQARTVFLKPRFDAERADLRAEVRAEVLAELKQEAVELAARTVAIERAEAETADAEAEKPLPDPEEVDAVLEDFAERQEGSSDNNGDTDISAGDVAGLIKKATE